MKPTETKLKRPLVMALVLAILMSLALPMTVFAEEDEINNSWVRIHPTTDAVFPENWVTENLPSDANSTLEILDSDGNSVEPVENAYTVSAGSTLSMTVLFHMDDRSETVTYKPGDYFTIDLPAGINFTALNSALFGDWGSWELVENQIKVTITEALSDIDYELWGKISLEGIFQPREDGDGADTGTIKLGDQTYTIEREEYVPPTPSPNLAELSKEGNYDPSRNVIDWTVILTAPDNETLNGATFIDTLTSNNHEYVTDSFKVGLNGAEPSVATPVPSSGSWTYTFDDTDTSNHITSATITYSTTPKEGTDFSVNQTFTNKAQLNKDNTQYAEPVNGEATVPAFFTKSGQVDPTAADPSRIRWEVKVTVPSIGTPEATLLDATITDTMDSRLTRLTDPAPQIKFGSSGPVDITEAIGTLSEVDADNSFTFKFVDGQVKIGTTVTLIYYTSLKSGTELENNDTISFSNDATFTWTLPTGSGIIGNSPSIGASVEKTIAAGGLLNKTVDGNTLKSTTVTYNSAVAGQDDYIQWVVVVNANRITMTDAVLTDTIPVGHKLIINGTHKFNIASTNASAAKEYTSDSVVPPLTITNDNAGFTYSFGTSTSDKYTFTFWTQLIDVNTNSKDDAEGKDRLYLDSPATYTNDSKLVYTNTDAQEKTLNSSASKSFNTDMLQKTDVGGYKYDSRTAEWKLTVNTSRLTMTNAVVTDVLPKTNDSTPIQMVLVGSDISAFAVKVNGTQTESHGITLDKTTTDAKGRIIGFELKLPSPTSDTFEITYKTELPDDALLTQWDSSKTFENSATLTIDERPTNYTAQDSVSVKNPVVNKSGTWKKDDAEINWIVDINPGLIDLNNATITDTMSPASALELLTDSVKLYKVGVDSSTGALIAADMTEENLVPSTSYTLTPGTDSFTVKLPDGPYAYKLLFTTSVLVNTQSITNKVSMEGEKSPTGEKTSDTVQVTDQFGTGGKGNYQLKIKKVDSDTGDAIEGATFKLVTTSNADFKQSGNVITAITGPDGIATFTGLPGWDFYIEETSPAAGYLMPENPKTGSTYKPVKTDSDADERTLTNVLGKADVEINKVGVGDPPANLSGGEFKLTGTSTYNGETFTIENVAAVNGKVTFENVPIGTYTITETQAPTGHITSGTTIYAKVDYAVTAAGTDYTKVEVTYSTAEDGTYTTPIPTFTNTPKNTDIDDNPGISFYKYGANKSGEAGTALGGVTFTLKNVSGASGFEQTATSADSTGLVSFTDIPYGIYDIYETVPEGYLSPNANPSDTPIYRVVVGYNDAATGLLVTMYDGEDYENIVYDSSDENSEPPVFINYKAVADVEFTKLSSQEPEPKPGDSPASPKIKINGGRFKISGIPEAASAATNGDNYEATASAKNNKVLFENVPVNAEGEFYTIIETSPPTGYFKTSEKLYVSVRYTDETKTATEVVFVDDDGEPIEDGKDPVLKNTPDPYTPPAPTPSPSVPVTETPTPTPTPETPEQTDPVDPEKPHYVIPPDPSDPDSPDEFVLVDENGTPLGNYTKVDQQYFDENGIPLSGPPQTGDGMPLLLWVAILAAGIAVLMVLVIKKPAPRKKG